LVEDVKKLVVVKKPSFVVIDCDGLLARCSHDNYCMNHTVLACMHGTRYHRFAHGIYESEVAVRRGMIKSVGHERTFETNTNDYDVVLKTLDSLCQKVHKRIVGRKTLFKTVTVKIRYGNFETQTHGKTLSFFTNRLQDLQKAARELTQCNLRGDLKIRLVGVPVSNLRSSIGQRTLV